MNIHNPHAGDIFAIPADGVFGLAKIIFMSDRYKHLILIRLFADRASSAVGLQMPNLEAASTLYYTSSDSVEQGNWIHIGRQEVTSSERAMSKRVSAGELWMEDTHLGPASESDLKSTKRLRVYGHRLITRAVARDPE